MTEDILRERAITSFAARLDAYAQTLHEDERRLLESLVIRAADPLERVRWRSGALEPDEETLLRDLDSRADPGSM